MKPIVYILLSGLLGVSGQLILKSAVNALGPLGLTPEALPATVVSLMINPFIIGGLTIYLSGTFFWLVALSRADLGYAFPFASLNYVLILVSAWLFLGEQPSLSRIAGVVVIVGGVWAIARTPARTGRPSMMARPVSTKIVSQGVKQ